MKIKTIILAMFAAIAMTNLTACSESEEGTPVSKVAGYKFELTLSSVDGTDHDDVIKTSYSYKNNNGDESTGIYNAFPQEKIESQLFKTLPDTLMVNVLEELKSDVELTKSEYKLGLGIELNVYSVAEDNTVISFKPYDMSSTITIAVEDLKNIYPETTSLIFAIDKDGEITKVE